MVISNKVFFGPHFHHPVIKALTLMWNKKGGEGFAAVCGGYTAHKVGLTNTFAGTK